MARCRARPYDAATAGLLTTILTARAAAWWARTPGGSWGLVGYLAARTMSRRRETVGVVLPITAALAIAVFTGAIYTTAARLARRTLRFCGRRAQLSRRLVVAIVMPSPSLVHPTNQSSRSSTVGEKSLYIRLLEVYSAWWVGCDSANKET